MNRIPGLLSILVLSASLFAFGCSGGGSKKPYNNAPEALTYAVTSCVYTQGEAIAQNTPAVTKEVTGWSVDPDLPAGLAIDVKTGVISGTPTVLQAAKEYTVKAENSYGSTTTVISITVNLAPPKALNYTTTSAVYTKGIAIDTNAPAVTGTVTSWTVSPALPAGLNINSTTGSIYGTPTVLQQPKAYMITASNPFGAASVLICITVNIAAPSALSYSPSNAVYTEGFVIPNNVPSVSGTVSFWSVTPDLPAGLSFSTTTGVISGTPAAEQDAKNYTITAVNPAGSATAKVTITINEASPSALSYAVTSASYTKSEVIQDNVPSVTGTVTGWTIEPALPAGLTLNTTTGVISGTPTALQSAVTYVITASNYSGETTAVITIAVNLAAPEALTYTATTAVYTKGIAIAENIPTVSETVTSWSVSPALPAGLTLNTTTGVISGTPAAEQGAKNYTVTAENAYGRVKAILMITVNIAAPQALNYAVTSAVYTRGLAAAGNSPTVTGTVTAWSITPDLPAGLALSSSTGAITGTPALIQDAAEYTIIASNYAGSASAVVSIAVNIAAPAALSYATTSAVYTRNAVIIDNVPSYSGTVSAWSVTPALPAGLTLNTSTGVISGKPAAAQSAEEYTITAANSSGSTTAVVSITVNLEAPAALSYSAPSAVYTYGAVITNNTPTVTGTVTSYTVSPALPAGLAINSTTGVISGTPTAIQSPGLYTVTAENDYGLVKAAISIMINYEAPTTLSYTTAASVYSQGAVITNNTPSATGTVTKYAVSPALPSGLTLNTTTGAISGTPTGSQSAANYTVIASNAAGYTTAVVSITVNSSAPKALSYAAGSSMYLINRVIKGNTPAVTGTVSSYAVTPALPAGLTLNTTTGVISGTPTAAKPATTYTITAVNSYGSTTAKISISVLGTLNLTPAVTTFAGGGQRGFDGIGTAATFDNPGAVTLVGSNLYVADTRNHKIRKIVIATGVVTTLAGSGAYGSTDGTGTAATFYSPYGITSDGTNLYVADTNNHKIRKIVIASGVVTTLAGSGASGGVDATGTAASFYFPFGIMSDGTNLYVADTNNHKIRKIVIASGVVTTLAGSGASGGVDATGTAASFYYPQGIASDGTNLYVADSFNHKIRKIIIASGVVTTLAGSGASGTADGTGTVATFNSPYGLTSDGTNLYVSDTNNHKIRKIVIASGVVTTLAGSGTQGSADATGTAATFYNPHGITSDGTNLYVADSSNNKIRKIVIASGVVTTLAGSGSLGGVDATGTAASFNFPYGITSDGTNLYVADSYNHKIRKIVIASGVVTTLAGSGTQGSANGTGTAASFYNPSGITSDGTNLYVADTYNHKIRKIVIATGVVTTLAGSGASGSTDGTGTAASFYNPYGITSDGTNLYVADTFNNKIRKIVIASGVVTTLAGSGASGCVDATGTAASFNFPFGITSDGMNLYVADLHNNKIRKIVIASGIVTTLAGSGASGGVDATGTSASFFYPKGITSDGTNLYVADSFNNKIRKIVIASGVVTTLAGSGVSGSTNNIGTAASFSNPCGITTDGLSLYVADTSNNLIRKIQ